MVIVSCLYLFGVYLVFYKWKLLPWNKKSKAGATLIGIVILTLFLVGLQGSTPASSQAVITGPITEIAPQVAGRVTEVLAQPNVPLLPGEVIFRLDPLQYAAQVDQLTASLADAEAGVAQLKETYDAARATTQRTREQLALADLRRDQAVELERTGAGTGFAREEAESTVAQLQESLVASEANERAAYAALTASVGDTQSRVAQVLAQLEVAQDNLAQTEIKAPAGGVATFLTLRPGMQVSPSRSVVTFVNTQEIFVVGLFAQKALEHVQLGDEVKVSFPALPGRLFDATVADIPHAIGEGQFYASGQLPRVSDQRMTREYPIVISLPPDFPVPLRKVGVAANATIYTEGAGVVGAVALVLQWIGTSLDYVI
jgi:multidrug resistance efflux pump